MPAGRMLQCAPRSPEADPAFQQVAGGVKASAASQKQHAPTQQKASEAAAAQMPEQEKQGQAQNTQTGELDATAAVQAQAAQGGKAPGFNEQAFVNAVRKRIDELTPADPKQMENIKDNPAFGSGARQAVDAQVESGKKATQGPVSDKLKEAPDTSAVPDKPTTALPGNPPGAAPAAPDARGAAPKQKGPEEVELPVHAQS